MPAADDWTLLASHQLEDGLWMTLVRRVRRAGDRTIHDHQLRVAGYILMEAPRSAESSRKLAEYALAGVRNRSTPRVLIGGLGFGFTLAEALDRLPRAASVIVSELHAPVVVWNETHLFMLEGHRLADSRVKIEVEDVLARIDRAQAEFDAILLDVDNGPVRFHRKENDALYSDEGMAAAVRALAPGGVLGVWSAFDSSEFERRMVSAGLSVRRHEVKTESESAVIWCGYKR